MCVCLCTFAQIESSSRALRVTAGLSLKVDSDPLVWPALFSPLSKALLWCWSVLVLWNISWILLGGIVCEISSRVHSGIEWNSNFHWIVFLSRTRFLLPNENVWVCDTSIKYYYRARAEKLDLTRSHQVKRELLWIIWKFFFPFWTFFFNNHLSPFSLWSVHSNKKKKESSKH